MRNVGEEELYTSSEGELVVDRIGNREWGDVGIRLYG